MMIRAGPGGGRRRRAPDGERPTRQRRPLPFAIEGGRGLQGLPQTTGGQHGHVPRHTDPIAQRAQTGGAPGRRAGDLQADHPGQGGAQGGIKPFRRIGIAGDQGMAMATDPGEGLQGIRRRGAAGGFTVASRREAALGRSKHSPINAGRQFALAVAATGVAAPHLGGKVVGVGVEIGLGAAIGGPLLQGTEPTIQSRMTEAQLVALVIGEAGVDPLEKGHEHQVRGAETRRIAAAGGSLALGGEGFEKEGARALLQGLANFPRQEIEAGLGDPLLLGTPTRIAEPLAPGPEQAALQLPQGPDSGSVERPTEGTEGLLKGLKDAVAFRDQHAIEFEGRQIAAGHQIEIPPFLLPVADHRHLAHPVGDPAFLQPEPDLLAIGAPGVVVAIQGHPNGGLRLTEEAKGGLGVGGSVHPVPWRKTKGDQLIPAGGLLQVRHGVRRRIGPF